MRKRRQRQKGILQTLECNGLIKEELSSGQRVRELQENCLKNAKQRECLRVSSECCRDVTQEENGEVSICFGDKEVRGDLKERFLRTTPF